MDRLQNEILQSQKTRFSRARNTSALEQAGKKMIIKREREEIKAVFARQSLAQRDVRYQEARK